MSHRSSQISQISFHRLFLISQINAAKAAPVQKNLWRSVRSVWGKIVLRLLRSAGRLRPSSVKISHIMIIFIIKSVGSVKICVTYKNLALFLRISGNFCTFAVQKNITYLCLKTQDLSVARSSRRTTFLTSNRCQPGWNWRPFCSTIPPCHISRNRNAARFFRQM